MIVFGLIITFSAGAVAQCTVRDLSQADQKKIITRFALGARCDSLRLVDSVEIFDLRLDKRVLQEDMNQAVQDIELMQLNALKRKKWPWIAGAAGFAVGVIAGTRIK